MQSSTLENNQNERSFYGFSSTGSNLLERITIVSTFQDKQFVI